MWHSKQEMYCHPREKKSLPIKKEQNRKPKLGKTGRLLRDVTTKSLKAQLEEWMLHKNAGFEAFHFILDQSPLHLKFQWSIFASVPSCSCKEGDKADWSRYEPQVT